MLYLGVSEPRLDDECFIQNNITQILRPIYYRYARKRLRLEILKSTEIILKIVNEEIYTTFEEG